MVALLVIKATRGTCPAWSWWWFPIPAFALPSLAVAVPLVPRRKKRRYSDGPDVRALLLKHVGGKAHPLESVLEDILRGLHTSWKHNKNLLDIEAFWLEWGIILFSVVAAVTVGLCTWKLS